METASAYIHIRVMWFTCDTGNVLHVTFNGLAALLRCSKVIPLKVTSEFIGSQAREIITSALQVFNGLSFQRLKIFQKLDIQKQSVHVTGQCCSVDLTDEELELIDKCFENAADLTVIERSSYYISGYLTYKENINVETISVKSTGIRVYYNGLTW